MKQNKACLNPGKSFYCAQQPQKILWLLCDFKHILLYHDVWDFHVNPDQEYVLIQPVFSQVHSACSMLCFCLLAAGQARNCLLPSELQLKLSTESVSRSGAQRRSPNLGGTPTYLGASWVEWLLF